MTPYTIEIIEYADTCKWYLTIGHKAPWDNMHIRIPKFFANIIMNTRTRS